MTLKPDPARINDKAVEAAARAWSGAPFPSNKSKAKARAAIQAALPVPLEGKAEEIARVIALAGLGSLNGTRRDMPENWGDEKQWRTRILEVIPAQSEVQCRDLANRIISSIMGESDEQAG